MTATLLTAAAATGALCAYGTKKACTSGSTKDWFAPVALLSSVCIPPMLISGVPVLVSALANLVFATTAFAANYNQIGFGRSLEESFESENRGCFEKIGLGSKFAKFALLTICLTGCTTLLGLTTLKVASSLVNKGWLLLPKEVALLVKPAGSIGRLTAALLANLMNLGVFGLCLTPIKPLILHELREKRVARLLNGNVGSNI